MKLIFWKCLSWIIPIGTIITIITVWVVTGEQSVPNIINCSTSVKANALFTNMIIILILLFLFIIWTISLKKTNNWS